MTESQADVPSDSGQKAAGLRRRLAPELLAALALAVLGSAMSLFAPASLPLHWGFGEGFGSFTGRGVVLIAIPWSCAVAVAVLTSVPRYRDRPHSQLSVRLLAGFSLGVLLMTLVYVAVGSRPLSGPE